MIGGLVNLIIFLLVVGILLALVWYVLDAIPIPQPINRIVKVAISVIAALVVILLLLQLIGVSTGVDVPKVMPQ
jgi:hypothetical protein